MLSCRAFDMAFERKRWCGGGRMALICLKQDTST